MNQLETILTIVCTISLLLNIGLVVYLRAAITRLLLVSEELGDFQDIINSFLSHLDLVYNLETFYGDQTLQNLLAHTTALSEQIELFDYIYYLTDDEQVDAEDEEETIENETN